MGTCNFCFKLDFFFFFIKENLYFRKEESYYIIINIRKVFMNFAMKKVAVSDKINEYSLKFTNVDFNTFA